MKVMHVLDSMVHGGAESLVVEHVRLASPGVASVICALNRGGPALELAERTGARTVLLSKGGARASGLSKLVALMREERVDVVNGHNPTGALYAALAARAAGVPVMFRTEHSIHYPGRHSPFYPALEVLSTALTRRVVCVCRAVLHSHVSRLPWAARRFVTVANGISPAPHSRARGAVRQELNVSPEDVLLLTVGSLTRQKAQHHLLDAFARVHAADPRVRLAIAGEGPLRPALEAQARALGLDGHLRLLGSRADVGDLMQGADLFVLSSEREGLPVTVLEAMAAGLPVVATRAGGTAEAVEEGRTGLIAPVGDVPALAAAIAALASDPARRTSLGQAGRARWSELFTAERMVRETEALYRGELASSRRTLPAPESERRAAS